MRPVSKAAARWRPSHRPGLVLWIAAAVLSTGVFAEERIDTGALGNRGVAWLAPVDESPGIHTVGTVGDIDGDGFEDIALGLLEKPYEETENPWALYVIYGRPRIVGEDHLSPELERSWQVRAVEPPEHARGSLVSAVAPAGDVDADSYGDFFISYGTYPHNRAGGGMALLVRGGPDLVGETTLEGLMASERVTVFRTSDPRYEEVGYECLLAGDFNGDGEEDIVLSAGGSRLDSVEEEGQGAVFVVFGVRDLPREVDVVEIGAAIPGMRIEGFEEEFPQSSNPIWGIGLGRGVATIGDFDGDGLSDLVLSATSGRPRRYYFVLGDRAPPAVLRLADASTHPKVIEVLGTTSGLLASQVAGLGDVNGDGLADLAFSRSVSNPSIFNPQQSWVQVVFGSRTFPREITIDAIESRGVRLRAVQEIASFGGRLIAAGDVDGDGRTDLGIGSSRADPEGREDAGEAYVLLSRDGWAEPSVLKGPFPGARLVGAEPGDGLGNRAFGPAGDFDGDGFDDLLIVGGRGRSSINPDPPRGPRAYLIYGGPASDSPLALLSVDPAHGTMEGGTEVTLRGAGFRDVPQVAFGARLAASVNVVSGSELRVVTPLADATGAVDVTVTIDGQSVTLPGGFEYTDHPEVNLDDLEGRGFVLRESEMDAGIGPSVAFGDITGDGIDELIAGGRHRGRLALSIVRGAADLPAAHAAFEPSPRLSVITSIDPALSAGQVAVPGDVNGDGLNDLIIGTRTGRAFLIFGRRDFPPEMVIEDELFFLTAARLVADDGFGSELRFAGVGDLTGDGLDDFAVGFARSTLVGPQAEPQGQGELVFVSGRATWPEDVDLDAAAFVRSRLLGAPREPGLAFQWLVTPAGDANGDGLRDVLVTVRSTVPGPAYLVYGSPDLPAEADLDAFIEAGGGVRIELEETTGGTVYARGAGDVNGDGFSDILISLEDKAATFDNLTVLVAGGPELATSIRLSRSPDAEDGALRVIGDDQHTIGAFYGNSVTAGDFNADGHADFLVGGLTVPDVPTFANISGNVSLILGRAGMPASPRAIDLKHLGSQGFTIAGHVPGTLRMPSETSGDLNGDGAPDFALLEEHLLPPEGRDELELDVEPLHQDTVYVIYGLPRETAPEDRTFVRGDSNSDGDVNITDGVFTLAHLFAGGEAPLCQHAADTDDDGGVLITDAIYLFEHLFAGGPRPPPPFPEAGDDPTDDELSCEQR